MKSKFKGIALTVCVMLACSAGIAFASGAAAAPPVAELGEAVGSAIVADGATYQNFTRGYVEYRNGDPAAIVAGYRRTADGAAPLAASAMTDALRLSATDPGVAAIAGERWTEALRTEVEASFAAKYESLFADGYVCGLACSDIDTWDDVVLKQDYRYGSSTAGADAALDGKRNHSLLIYNFSSRETSLVRDDFVAVYDEFHRALGAPRGDVGEYYFLGSADDKFVPETGRAYRAQLFEKGVILENAGNVEAHVAVIERIPGSNQCVLHPVLDDQDILSLVEQKVNGIAVSTMRFIGDLDGEWHPLRETFWETSADADGATGYTLYANYRGGAVRVDYALDYTARGVMRYAARNYTAAAGETGAIYELHAVAPEAVSAYEYLFEGYDAAAPGGAVEDAVLDYVRAYDRYAAITDDAELKALLLSVFRDAYLQAFDEGLILGYRASAVKKWELVVLDFKFGDSSAGFDAIGSGKRERMSSLVLNPADGKAYAVIGGVWNIFKNDEGIGRRALGYPLSNVRFDAEIGDEVFDAIQLFQYGYAYLNADSNEYFTQLGYGFDPERGEFTVRPAPSVPEKYGAETGKVTDAGTIYVNYQKGAVRCTLNRKGTRFRYDYYPGRNFDFDAPAGSGYTAELLPVDRLLTLTDLSAQGTMPDIRVDGERRAADFETEIRPKIYAKYCQLLESGYFPGFIEGKFDGSWNSIYAQQFIVGDSTGNPFGASRPGVTALVYDPNSQNVYFLRDSFIVQWQNDRNYETFLGPTSDEYRVTGEKYAAYGDYWFQTYSGGGIGVRKGNNAFLTLDYATPEAYLDALPETGVPSHGMDPDKGYIGFKNN